MATFGRFETIREIHRMGYTAVYTGRRPESTEEKYAIKILQPPALLLEAEQVKTQIDLFLKSADLQQKVAAAGAPHWAPVHECGSTPEGAFYVTEKYEHSLQQLVDVRLRLSGEALGSVVESVARGLLELKQSHGRPHGNLKATNVLIRGTGDISQRQIVLSDPLPQEYIDTEVHWDSDLRAIAEFIYQLVVHRPSPVLEGWQAPDSKEWHHLGKQAVFWRDLCNRLLNAAARPGTMTVETLLEDLTQLAKIRPTRSYRWPVVAGLIIIASAIALYMLLKKPPPPEKVQWETLCQEYLSWVGPLYEQGLSLNKKEGNLRVKRWGENAQLKEVLKQIKAAGYPYDVAYDEGMTVEYIVDKPHLAAARNTNDGLAAAETIKSFFDPNSSKAWPLLLELNETANQFNERGWEKPAAYLALLAASVKPEPNKPIAENVDRILELDQKGTLQKIRLSLQRIAEHRDAAKSTGDLILSKFNDQYVDRAVTSIPGIADQEICSKLEERLGEIEFLGQKLADFIRGDWQKAVDREAFVKDHEKDNVETVTDEIFKDRLTTIKGYCYLAADPRDQLNSLVNLIERYVREAQISNPKEADACAKALEELRPNIEDIRAIKAIAKNQQQIEQRIGQYQPLLDGLRDRADRARELPRDYVNRIKTEVVAIAQSDQINEKWITLRDNLLNDYPLSALEQKLELYSELRQKIDTTNHDLAALDKELQTQLPSQVGSEPPEKDWQRKLIQIYDQQRKETIDRVVEKIPVQNNTPDINDGPFKDFRLSRFSEFKQWRGDLAGILATFNLIENGLELYYVLDDDLPQSGETIRSSWEKWQNTNILKDPRISGALAELMVRIDKLKQIKTSADKQGLLQTAFDQSLHTEAAYAVWTRLGDLSELQWPNDPVDLDNDRKIRDQLITRFETLGDKSVIRASVLLETAARVGLKREVAFVEKNRSQDKILAQLGTATDSQIAAINAAYANDAAAALRELQAIEGFLRNIANIVAGKDWQSDIIQKELFFADSNVHKSQGPVSIETLRSWLQEVTDYRRLDADPRDSYAWQTKITEIQQLLHKGLSEQSSLTKENLAKLEQQNGKFADTAGNINALRALPPIKKHESRISSDRCRAFWNTLQTLEGDIRSIIKPPYCNRVELENGRLIFATDHLNPNFEPVHGDNPNPVQLPLGWEQIRQAIKEQQKQWLDFFYTIDGNDAANWGWPTCIRSVKDPSVVLSFVPAGPGNPEPFYMATREITNAQYRLYLKANAVYDEIRETVSDPNGTQLIYATSGDPGQAQLDQSKCQIQWDTSRKTFYIVQGQEDIPVTWVTYKGAKAYAKQLDAQLPTASQHAYACMARANTTYPWGNDLLPQIARYAHVRALAWQRAATEYNLQKKNDPLGTNPVALRPPVGAVEDVLEGDLLYPTRFVHQTDTFPSAWPVASQTEANRWRLHDMIGNVWEWCEDATQSVICGGSCLSPPKYALPDSKYSFDATACDVGFRIVVPAK